MQHFQLRGDVISLTGERASCTAFGGFCTPADKTIKSLTLGRPLTNPCIWLRQRSPTREGNKIKQSKTEEEIRRDLERFFPSRHIDYQAFLIALLLQREQMKGPRLYSLIHKIEVKPHRLLYPCKMEVQRGRSLSFYESKRTHLAQERY